jgi:hypothetical protein
MVARRFFLFYIKLILKYIYFNISTSLINWEQKGATTWIQNFLFCPNLSQFTSTKLSFLTQGNIFMSLYHLFFGFPNSFPTTILYVPRRVYIQLIVIVFNWLFLHFKTKLLPCDTRGIKEYVINSLRCATQQHGSATITWAKTDYFTSVQLSPPQVR